MMKKKRVKILAGCALVTWGGLAYGQITEPGFGHFEEEEIIHSEEIATVPSSPIQQVVNTTVLNQVVLPSVQPRVVQKAADKETETAPMVGSFRFAGADASVGSWEYDGDYTKGVSYGFVPSITMGEATELAISLPMFWTKTYDTLSPHEHYQFDLGLDLRINHFVNESLSVGAHVLGMRSNDEDRAGTDNKYSLTAGPFFSYTMGLTESLDMTVGGLLDMTTVHNDQRVLFGVAGVKFGYHLSESVALNPYVIYYRNMHQTHDDEASLDDRDYFTAGLETNIVMGSGWMLSGGVRSTLGYKDYDSLEVYFGTKFVF